MQGLMMHRELMISDLISHAEVAHGSREMFSRETDGSDFKYTWGDCAVQSKKLANALKADGMEVGDRFATIAWNNRRHVEIYYGVSGIGGVVHTINPRLDPRQIAWMINHAGDSYVAFDLTFAPIIGAVAASCPTVKKWIPMCSKDQMPDIPVDMVAYDEFVGDASAEMEWPRFDENRAAALCYTSGTTGDPKGVLYSHRSTVLHAMTAGQTDVLGLSAASVVLAVVPMFHVCAWGLVYAAAMVGAKMVMPGPNLDGPSLIEMINDQNVSVMCGVPTVWLGVLNELKASGGAIPTVKTATCGGSALPESLLRAYETDLGIPLRQGWGMTETSPIGVINAPLDGHETMDYDQTVPIKLLAGRRLFGVDLRIVDDEDQLLPNDGEATGHLHVRGPWVASGYFNVDEHDGFTDDGWFRTGDVAALHPSGYLEITDRSKDVIKSGGEWISSIEVENAAMNHPDVAMAACIGVRHEKWQERPLLVIQPVPGKSPDADEIKGHIMKDCAKWWVPDEIVTMDALPIGATGKVLKRKIKEIYKDVDLAKGVPEDLMHVA
jgi:fatty-acyl-CoA synthase